MTNFCHAREGGHPDRRVNFRFRGNDGVVVIQSNVKTTGEFECH